MIKIEINTPEKLLEKSVFIAKENRLHNIAFFSTKLSINHFFKKVNLKEEHLVYDFTEKTKNGEYLNASISVLLKSMLFIDFKDKSLYRTESGILDISDIRRMIIPLKHKYNVKKIYIDNFQKVTCTSMGRWHLYNISDPASIFIWKERANEYKMALLYYMSKKFEIDFIIGNELNKEVSNPLKVSDIKFIGFGNSYDMVDKIVAYNNGNKFVLK